MVRVWWWWCCRTLYWCVQWATSYHGSSPINVRHTAQFSRGDVKGWPYSSVSIRPPLRDISLSPLFFSVHRLQQQRFFWQQFCLDFNMHIIVYTLYICMHCTEPYMFLEARMRDINFVITPEVCSCACLCCILHNIFPYVWTSNVCNSFLYRTIVVMCEVSDSVKPFLSSASKILLFFSHKLSKIPVCFFGWLFQIQYLVANRESNKSLHMKIASSHPTNPERQKNPKDGSSTLLRKTAAIHSFIQPVCTFWCSSMESEGGQTDNALKVWMIFIYWRQG